ncbi:PREDICTED: proline-rich AKT1 substrate 1-like, partial [Thamnophis sirtalis]|uniref:Proline-rich AKT1 substrate 1-like n=1 Tax=Thamnophis sirtalis TaxID=35019 RepID=A0A6I9Z3I3_9SAUR
MRYPTPPPLPFGALLGGLGKERKDLCRGASLLPHSAVFRMTDMADNHKETWVALVAAAEQYRSQTGNEIVLLTAFRAPPPGNYSYVQHGSGALADAVQRYLEDITVAHKTTAFTYAAHPPSNLHPPPPQGSYSQSYPPTYVPDEPAPQRTPTFQRSQ